LLLIYLLIVSNLHQDYLAAVGPDGIDQVTFIYKWAAYIAGFVLYFGFHIVRGKLKTNEQNTKEKISESKELTDTSEDPFAAIRHRKRLRSRADFVIGEGDDHK